MTFTLFAFHYIWKKHFEENTRQSFSILLTQFPDLALNYVSEYDSVVSVFESKMNKLHTTHSWDFLGLGFVHKVNHMELDFRSNVIDGVIGSGNFYFILFYFLCLLILSSFIWIKWFKLNFQEFGRR